MKEDPVSRHFDASPADVFAVLADASTYAHFVVGTRKIRGSDPHWPAVGATLHHSVGFGPLSLRDTTDVLTVEAPHRLVLVVHIRPFLHAETTFTLTAQGSGTDVELRERPVGGLVSLPLLRPVVAQMIRARNTETLRRLESVVTDRRGSRA